MLREAFMFKWAFMLSNMLSMSKGPLYTNEKLKFYQEFWVAVWSKMFISVNLSNQEVISSIPSEGDLFSHHCSFKHKCILLHMWIRSCQACQTRTIYGKLQSPILKFKSISWGKALCNIVSSPSIVCWSWVCDGKSTDQMFRWNLTRSWHLFW